MIFYGMTVDILYGLESEEDINEIAKSFISQKNYILSISKLFICLHGHDLTIN